MLPKGNNIFCCKLLMGWWVRNIEIWLILLHCFYALKHGRPMLEYDIHKNVYA